MPVTLIEPSRRVGGMTAGGLGHTDLGMSGRELGGITREFYQRVSAHYGSGGGGGNGTEAAQCYMVEPKVATAVYGAMLAEANVTVLLGHQLLAARKERPADPARITTLMLSAAAAGKAAATVEVAAEVFIDAGYEGDLLAAAGVDYTVGREARDEYGEADAGRPAPNQVLSKYQFQQRLNHTTADGRPLPLIYTGPVAAVGAADAKVQAYTYRPCMTRLAGGNAVPLPKPRAYDPDRWELFRRLLASEPDATLADFIYFAGPLGNSTNGPGGKYDAGTNGAISMDFIGASWGYPDADADERARIVDDHVEYILGFWHFLATDPAVPDAVGREMRGWGLCADEFAGEEPAHFPRSALYVREARRMRGAVVVTEQDRVANTSKADSVGLGSYNCDCHMAERIIAPPIGDQRTTPVAPAWVLNEGWLPREFAHTAWELPYAMMVPPRAQATNLLVPVAVSASHVAFNGIRLEPTWSVLGHAAGTAAAMAAAAGGGVAAVDVPALQARLLAAGQIIRKADVPQKSPAVWCG